MIKNIIEFQVKGDYALFTTPNSKCSGDKTSYMVPTYEALKGIAKSIYWKPTFDYVIDEVRIMNEIKFESKGVLLSGINGKKDLSYYTYLKDVWYQVRAHIEWDRSRTEPDIVADRIFGKHISIANRAIKSGGRMNVFLGTSECAAYVEPCDYRAYAGCGAYAKVPDLSIGKMFQGFIYPNQLEDHEKSEKNDIIKIVYSDITMKYGVIHFLDPRTAATNKMYAKFYGAETTIYKKDVNFKSAKEETFK